jgi:Zn-dependent metalloprotease
MTYSIVPPYLLNRLAETDDERVSRASAAARRSLLVDPPLRRERAARTAARPTAAAAREAGTRLNRVISDSQGQETLPGVTVRRETDAATDDIAVTEAFDGLGATHALFLDAFGRNSIDDNGLPLLATVHYGEEYDNAFWEGSRMVFGDGDGEVFNRFTASLSVIGHELTHGVTQYTSALEYQGQSGALNESISDVFGALVEQYDLGQTAGEASWLIGEGLFTPAVQGRALRSMLEPGTAYDDDVLGRDPQPAHMSDYIDTEDDNGGVHLNSGIPNRAFAIAATTLGGPAWNGVGLVWYDAIQGEISPTATFSEFARLTVASAKARFGNGSPEHLAVEDAWQTVGVVTHE